MVRRTVEALNLVVRLGKDELLDLFENWVWPILLNGSLRGRGEIKRYEFLGVTPTILEDGTPIVYGRLLKVLEIEAEQDFDEKKSELVQSSKSMPSVPSSFFVIDLSSHKMAFLRETRRAPSSKDFETIFKRLFKRAWDKEYLRLQNEWLQKAGKKRLPKNQSDEMRRAIIQSLGGFPEIRLSPLPSVPELEKKLAAFSMITKVNVGVLETNNELSDEYEGFLRACQKKKASLHAAKVQLGVSAPKEGLDKAEVGKLVQATADGNFSVSIEGSSKSGAKLTTNLEEASFKTTLDLVPSESSLERAKRLCSNLAASLKDGMVVAKAPAMETVKKAVDLVNQLLREK